MSPLKKSGFITATIFLIFFVACNDKDSSSRNNRDVNNNNDYVSISITTTVVKAFVGESKTIPVTVQGNTSFTVSVDKAGSGCEKSGNNIVCKPTASGTYNVTATATADAAKKVSATLTVPELEIFDGDGQTLYADETSSATISFNAAGNWTATASDDSGGVPTWLSLGVVHDLSADHSTFEFYDDYSLFQSYDGYDYGETGVTVNAVSINGTAGNNAITVTFQPNDSKADRTAVIAITTSNGQIEVTITQRYVTKDGKPYTNPDEEFHAVNFIMDGDTVAIRQIAHNSSLGANMPPNPERTGYTFAGWSVSQSSATVDFYATTSVTANITVYAVWQVVVPNSCAVSFNIEGVTSTMSVECGKSLGANMPADPTKTGYEFVGWNTSYSAATGNFAATTMVTSDITVYAIWQAAAPVTHTVTFNVDGSAVYTRQTQNGTSLGANMPPNPIKPGYTFAGWSVSPSSATADFYAITTVTANITVYAVWQVVIPNSCAVDFNIDGAITTVSVECGKSLGANMPANPTKSGYEFVGWNSSPSAMTANFSGTTLVTSNITVYAIWGLPRYVATPVVFKADETSEIKNWRVDYALPVTDYDTWTDYDAYFIYLGKVDFVPIAANTAKHYNGVTPIELTYSTTETTESSVTESITNAISRTTQRVNTWDNVFSVEGKFGYEGIFYSASIKIGYQHNWGGSSSVNDEVSRTETYSTFSSWAKSNTETVRFTIGANNEAPGYYRYALMATCDVYVMVVHDLDANDWAYEFSMFARPDSLFEAIDYSTTNSFGVGANAEVLKFDNDLINELLGLEKPERSWVTVYNAEIRSDGIELPREPGAVDLASIVGRSVPPTPDSVRITFNYEIRNLDYYSTTIVLATSGIINTFGGYSYDYTFYGGVLTKFGTMNSNLRNFRIIKIEFLQ